MMQPFFCGKEDLEWMQWWLKVSTDASNVKDKVYVPNELFLELALTFNNIKFKHGIITYNREYKGPHIIVKDYGKLMTQLFNIHLFKQYLILQCYQQTLRKGMIICCT